MNPNPQPCSHSAHHDSPRPHPIDTLLAEHEVILAVLEALEVRASEVRRGGSFDRRAWSLFAEFLGAFADRCHHGKEEELLFPVLAEHGVPDAGGPIGAMKIEHEEGRSLIRDLSAAIERGDASRAVAAASSFIGLLREHIAKENGVLFPLGRQLLDAPSVERIAEGFARVESEIMGEGTHCRYVDLAQRICADAGVDFATRRADTLAHHCCRHR